MWELSQLKDGDRIEFISYLPEYMSTNDEQAAKEELENVQYQIENTDMNDVVK